MYRFPIKIKHSNSLGSQNVEIKLKENSVQCQDAKPVETEDNETKEEFEKYPCKYCNINIANEYHLEQIISGIPS